MTQEPREPLADEAQAALEETDELAEQESPSVDEAADHSPDQTNNGEETAPEDLTEPFEEDPDPAERTEDELLPEDQITTTQEATEEPEQDEEADSDAEEETAEDTEPEPVDEEQLEQDEEAAKDTCEPSDVLENDEPVEDEEAEGDSPAETLEEEQDGEGEGAERTAAASPEPEGEVQAPTVESVIEAILFATDEPLTEGRLAKIVETTSGQVRKCIKALNEKYEKNHNAFRIEQIAGGHQMLTLGAYDSWLRKMLKARSDSKLSPAAMETLAIIAYKQPVIRVDIEAIRGVAVGEVIRSLMYKGLVKIVGRAEILGRPMLYGTTKKFLEVFGLHSLKDLPKAEELKRPE